MNDIDPLQRWGVPVVVLEYIKAARDFIRQDAGVDNTMYQLPTYIQAYVGLGRYLFDIEINLEATLNYRLPKFSFCSHWNGCFGFFWRLTDGNR